MVGGRKWQRVVTGAESPGMNSPAAQMPYRSTGCGKARSDADKDRARAAELTFVLLVQHLIPDCSYGGFQCIGLAFPRIGEADVLTGHGFPTKST